MIREVKAPGGGPRAADLRRGAGALPLVLYSTPSPEKTQTTPPSHLTPHEAKLWAEAERVKSIDHERFCNLRRRLLLAQAARWEVTR